MKTFKCKFGKVTCEMQVTDTAPTFGETHIQKVEWTGGNPTPKLLRPYIAWVNSVNQILADEWGKRIMHAFQIPSTSSSVTAEIWKYPCQGKTLRIETPENLTKEVWEKLNRYIQVLKP